MTKFDFKVGDKVRLTGRDWDPEKHGVSAGDIVEISLLHGGYSVFHTTFGPFYVFDDPGSEFSAELVQAAGSRFKVGDRVTLTGSGWGSSLAGTEQVVAGFEDDVILWDVTVARAAYFENETVTWYLDESEDDPFAAEVVTDTPEPGDVNRLVELGPDSLISSFVGKKAKIDAVSPDHYKFGDVQVRDISGHLTSFGGQALQYVARATRLDGQNKGNPVEDLKKARRLLKWEIKRLEAQE